MTSSNTLDTASVLGLLTKLLTKLEGIVGATGLPASTENTLIDKNVVQGPASTFFKKPKISPTLTGNEPRAVRNVADIFAKAFYEFNLKKKTDEKPQTLVRKLSSEKIQPTKEDKKSDNLDKKDLGLLGIIAAVIAAAGLIWTYLGPLGAFITKFALKLPRLLKELRGGLSALRLFVEQKWPRIAQMFEPVTKLATRIKDFFKIKWDKFKASFKALSEGMDSIANLFRFGKPIEDIGKGATQASKSLKPVLETTGKTVGGSLLKRIKFIPFIGSLASFTFAYFRFKEGQWVRGTIEILSGLLNLSGALWPISLMLDGMLIIYDLLEPKDEAAAGTVSLKTGKMLIKPVLKSVAKKLGMKVLSALKFVPFLGSLANFAAAYIRFKDGQWVRGTLEIVAGILSLLGPTHALAMVIDGALILYDLMEVKETDTGKAAVATKATTKAILPMLKSLGLKLGLKFLSVAKFIPVIGGLANIALGFYRIQKGEWVAGIFEFISGIADFIPGYGTAVSLIIDGGLILYDLLKTPKKEGPAVKKSSNVGDTGKQLEQAGTSMFGDFVERLWYIPGLSSIMYIGRGIGRLFSGNYTEGLLDLARSVPALFGGKWLIDVLENAAGFFATKNNSKPTPDVKAKQFTFWGLIGDMLGALGRGITSAISGFIDGCNKVIDDSLSWAEKKIYGESKRDIYAEAQDQVKRTEQTSKSLSAVQDIRVRELQMEKWDPAIFNNFLNNLKVKGYTKQHDDILQTESNLRSLMTSERKDKAAIEKTQQHLTTLYGEANNLIKASNVSQQAERENLTRMFNERDNRIEVRRQEEIIPAPVIEVKTHQVDLDAQNGLINRQTSILSEMLLVSKQQLAATKDTPTQPVVVQTGGGTASSVNMNNAFSTSKGDGRTLYNSSPYSLNVT